MKKIIKIGLFFSGIIASLLILSAFLLSKPLPKGEQGEKADALALKMVQSINTEAWDDTGVIEWTFGGQRGHLWDKQRDVAQVVWPVKAKKQTKAIFNTKTLEGSVIQISDKGENIIGGDEKKKLIKEAWKIWVNDSFWLNPISYVFSENIERRYVKDKQGKEALLITYLSGGATPGDSYLWYLDENGLPYLWRMWVSIIPIGGLSATWEGWSTLETGVKISTIHKSPIMTIKVENVKAYKDIDSMQIKDPFMDIIENTNK